MGVRRESRLKLLPRRLRTAAGDAGFTLIEVMAAMLIMGVVGSAMAAVATESLQGQAIQRQNQQAAYLAVRAVEQVRALPYDTVLAGIPAAQVATDPRVVSGTVNGETLLTGSQVESNTPLNPYRVTAGDDPGLRLDGVDYTVAVYPTECWMPEGNVTTCQATKTQPTDTQAIRVTAFVTWNQSPNRGGQEYRVSTLVYSAESCMSTQTHPFSGPCQAYFYANARAAMGTVGFHGYDAATDAVLDDQVLPGSQGTSAQLTLAEAISGLQLEQVATAGGSSRASVAKELGDDQVLDSSGGVTQTAAANTDPADGTTQTQSVTLNQSSHLPLSITGSDSQLVLDPGGETGSAMATTVAEATSQCVDLGGSASLSRQPCASSAVTPAAATATLGFADSRTAVLFASDAGTLSRAFTNRQSLTGSGRCSGVGCVISTSQLNSGEVRVGGSPTGFSGAGAWTGFLFRVDAYQMTMGSESGIQPTAPSGSPSGSALLRYWNGNGYSTAALNAGAGDPLTLPEVHLSGPEGLDYYLSGEVVVNPLSVASTGVNPCAELCAGNAQSAPLLEATVKVRVEHEGQVLLGIAMDVQLGNVSADTSYREAPGE